MKRKVGLLSLMVALCLSAFAQKPSVVTSNEPGWHKIGEASASFKVQSESIVVLGADQFSSLKLRVTDAPINIQRLQVFYEDGAMEEISVDNELQAGSETRTIDLEANKDIKKVAFTYKTMPNHRGDKAQIELYGFKENDATGTSEAYRAKEKTERAVGKADAKVDETAEDVSEKADDVGDEARKDADKTKTDLERAAEKTADGVSEAAGKAEAEIVDEVHETKVGPGGERIYIDKDDKFYYINDKGNKVYVTATQLKDKQKNK